MEIKDKLREFVKSNFLLGSDMQLHDDDSFMKKGIIDSTGILEVVSFVEQSFNIRIHDDELLPANLDSISNLHAFIQRKTA